SENRERNITEEIRAWLGVTSSNFRVTDCYAELSGVTKEEKNAIRAALVRFERKGVIEKIDNGRYGGYRVVNREVEIIDWQNATGDEIKIKWPFGIEDYVLTLPKNIAIVAGSPNAGKTAFLLNVIKDNMDRFPINYFSSEMGPLELKTRLGKFEIPKDAWKFN